MDVAALWSFGDAVEEIGRHQHRREHAAQRVLDALPLLPQSLVETSQRLRFFGPQWSAKRPLSQLLQIVECRGFGLLQSLLVRGQARANLLEETVDQVEL